MTLSLFLRAYAAALATCFALDLVWLGLVARTFYQQQLGTLMRPDVRWAPAILFYLIYVGAVVALVVVPAVERQSLSRAFLSGGILGLAAYAAYDLTSLAMIRDYPTKVALVDLAWGTTLTATVAVVSYLAVRGMMSPR